MKFISYLNKTIEYSFYALFFFVPLAFAGNTSELFEFNKMWITFGCTIIVATAWISKMIINRRVAIHRTPLDIPIGLFLLSQIISTIFSMDPHVSWWGYYSRFNGGLLSTISYILLYYAFVSNLEVKHVLKSITISIVAGIIVALWGFPSHFGADPTCFVFRGTFDTSCWTDAFKPTVRAFSTIGQPDWLSAYLAVLLPISMYYSLKSQGKKSSILITSCFSLLASLFYVDLIFANARAGFVAFWVANLLFWLIIYFKNLFNKQLFLKSFLLLNACFLLLTFLFGSPVGAINKFTWNGLKSHFAAQAPQTPETSSVPQTIQATTAPQVPASNNITDSGKIRLYVWQGAIDAWKANALFGTGVETFAFAYYKYRPAGHNLTSEWDYLYNKAHNEYLNYLTTTGLLGLGSYLAFIILFVFLFGKYILTNSSHSQSENSHTNHNKQAHKNNQALDSGHWTVDILTIALFSSWITILITNFFGFSVVIMNVFLFIIPAFVLILQNKITTDKTFSFPLGSASNDVNPFQWTVVLGVIVVACILILGLFRYWYADVAYALGSNLDHVNQFEPAYQQLTQAVSAEPGEPVYQDELSINLAALSAILYDQKDTTNGAQFAQKAIALSNQVVSQHPNNVVFWKNRVRVFYTIAQGDKANQGQYYAQALQAIQKASELAPSDAKTWYNLGVLYGQTGDLQKGITVLQRVIQLKPDYKDAYFALGLFYHQLAVDKNDKVTDPAMQQKAIETYQYILDHLAPDDKEVSKSLQEWKMK